MVLRRRDTAIDLKSVFFNYYVNHLTVQHDCILIALMAKKKPEKSTGAKPNPKAITVTDWRIELQNLDVNKLVPSHTCDVAILMESDEHSKHVLEKFHYASTEDPNNAVKSIKVDNLLSITAALHKNVSNNPKDTLTDVLFELAAIHAIEQITLFKRIPLEILAKLIKLYILSLIQKDHQNKQHEMLTARTLEAERTAFLTITSNEGGDKKKKGKDKKSAKKEKGKKGKKGDQQEPGQLEACDSKTQLKPKITSKLTSSRKEDREYNYGSIEVEKTHLIFALVGFYDYTLINELSSIGVPITCILETSTPEEIVYYEEKPETVTKAVSSLIEVYSDPVYHQTSIPDNSGFQPATKTENEMNLDKSNSIISGDEESSRCIVIQAIQEFWNNVRECYEGKSRDDLRDTFIERYECKYNEIVFVGSDSYNTVSTAIFLQIVEKLIDIPNIKRKHLNYLQKIKICDVEPKPKRITTKCLSTYTKLMNKVPPECFSETLLLYCLVQEVCQLVPDPVSKESDVSNKSSKVFDAKDEDNKKTHNKTHDGLRRDLLNVIARQKAAALAQTKRPPIKHQWFKPDPKTNLQQSKSPFVVNELNTLEIKSTCYKSLSNELYRVNREMLHLCPILSLWEKYAPYKNENFLMYKLSMRRWCQKLGLKTNELNNAINVIAFSMLNCENHNKRLTKKYVVQKDFPYRTVTMLLEEAEATLNKLRCPSSTDDVLSLRVEELNMYENYDLSSMRWTEDLPDIVLLQELNNALEEYACFEHKYCPLTDSIVIKFHKDVDQFGVNTKIWMHPLRTPVRLRDFCRYIIHEESSWIEQQEIQYAKKLEEQAAAAQSVKQTDMELAFNPPDFIQPGSFKDVFMGQKALKRDPSEIASAKENPKSSKGSAKDKKADKKNKDDKKKGNKIANAAPSIQLPEEDKYVLYSKAALSYCAKPGEPHSFIGYDIGESRLQLTGSTTAFHSLDGVKVTVDSTGWSGKSKKISINVSCNNNCLIFHYDQITARQPLMFHLYTADSSIIAFVKPSPPVEVIRDICNTMCHTLQKTRKTGAASIYALPRQSLYFVSEKHLAVVKTFNVPHVSRKHLILEEPLLEAFIDYIEELKINSIFDPVYDSNLPLEEIPPKQRLSNKQRPQSKKSSRSGITEKLLKLKKCYEMLRDYPGSNPKFPCMPKHLAKLIVEKSSISSRNSSAEYFLVHSKPSVIKIKRPVSETNRLSQTALKTETEILEKIKTAIDCHIPVFKICSSRLHRYKYVKRVKSHIEIPIGNIIKRIACKPRYCRTKRTIEVSKCFPICLENDKTKSKLAYEFRASLPSGLLIRSVHGSDSDPFQIKQFYIDQGPLCKNIVHEQSRTYMRNGNIVIKKSDGDIQILGVSGKIIECEIPYFKQKSRIKTEYKLAEPKQHKNSTKRAVYKNKEFSLHAGAQDVEAFQKMLQRTIRRRHKYMIDGSENRFLLSRRAYLRNKKKYLNDPQRVYVLQNLNNPFSNYSIVNAEGKQIKITSRRVSEEKKYQSSVEEDFGNEEIYCEREDGFHSLLNREGLLRTEFPDGTRITTWYTIAEELIYFEEEKTTDQVDEEVQAEEDEFYYLIPDSMKKTTLTMESTVTGWVLVSLHYQYEHPNYASVTYNGETEETNVLLPNNILITATKKGFYTVGLSSNICATIIPEKILLETQLCRGCSRTCVSTLYVEPLYQNVQPEPELQLFKIVDSYKKIFTVDYSGRCTKNTDFITHRLNRVGCVKHQHILIRHKMIVMNRDFSGSMLWDTTTYIKTLADAFKNNDAKLHAYAYSDQEEPQCLELRSYIYTPYPARFINTYTTPKLCLSKYVMDDRKGFIVPAYCSQRIMHLLPNIMTLKPIFEIVIKLCNEQQTHQQTFFAFSKDLLEQTEKKGKPAVKELDVENMLSQPKASAGWINPEEENPIDKCPNVASALSLYHKWLNWHSECERCRMEYHSEYVPGYFSVNELINPTVAPTEELGEETSFNESSEATFTESIACSVPPNSAIFDERIPPPTGPNTKSCTLTPKCPDYNKFKARQEKLRKLWEEAEKRLAPLVETFWDDREQEQEVVDYCVKSRHNHNSTDTGSGQTCSLTQIVSKHLGADPIYPSCYIEEEPPRPPTPLPKIPPSIEVAEEILYFIFKEKGPLDYIGLLNLTINQIFIHHLTAEEYKCVPRLVENRLNAICNTPNWISLIVEQLRQHFIYIAADDDPSSNKLYDKADLISVSVDMIKEILNQLTPECIAEEKGKIFHDSCILDQIIYGLSQNKLRPRDIVRAISDLDEKILSKTDPDYFDIPYELITTEQLHALLPKCIIRQRYSCPIHGTGDCDCTLPPPFAVVVSIPYESKLIYKESTLTSPVPPERKKNILYCLRLGVKLCLAAFPQSFRPTSIFIIPKAFYVSANSQKYPQDLIPDDPDIDLAEFGLELNIPPSIAASVYDSYSNKFFASLYTFEDDDKHLGDKYRTEPELVELPPPKKKPLGKKNPKKSPRKQSYYKAGKKSRFRKKEVMPATPLSEIFASMQECGKCMDNFFNENDDEIGEETDLEENGTSLSFLQLDEPSTVIYMRDSNTQSRGSAINSFQNNNPTKTAYRKQYDNISSCEDEIPLQLTDSSSHTADSRLSELHRSESMKPLFGLPSLYCKLNPAPVSYLTRHNPGSDSFGANSSRSIIESGASTQRQSRVSFATDENLSARESHDSIKDPSESNFMSFIRSVSSDEILGRMERFKNRSEEKKYRVSFDDYNRSLIDMQSSFARNLSNDSIYDTFDLPVYKNFVNDVLNLRSDKPSKTKPKRIAAISDEDRQNAMRDRPIGNIKTAKVEPHRYIPFKTEGMQTVSGTDGLTQTSSSIIEVPRRRTK